MKLQVKKIKTSELSEEERKKLLFWVFDLVFARNKSLKKGLINKSKK